MLSLFLNFYQSQFDTTIVSDGYSLVRPYVSPSCFRGKEKPVIGPLPYLF